MATQDERWMARYRECLRFLEEEGRKPSKHYPEERNLRSWYFVTNMPHLKSLIAQYVWVFQKSNIVE